MVLEVLIHAFSMWCRQKTEGIPIVSLYVLAIVDNWRVGFDVMSYEHMVMYLELWHNWFVEPGCLNVDSPDMDATSSFAVMEVPSSPEASVAYQLV